MVSLLIPAFNEEGCIDQVVRRAHDVLTKGGEEFEIVVIDDGSRDKTAEILRGMNLPHLRVVTHPVNRGYGAAMKTGIRHSKGELIAMTDADGTYPLEMIPEFVALLKKKELDMVVGARTKKGVKIPLIRRPAKALVALLARILTGIKIPDINSGLRVYRRPLAERFMHLYPQGFSFTITITLAALTNDYLVEYVPIDYYKRIGKSTLSSGFNGFKNFIAFLHLIVRIVTYFRPLRFFGGIASFLLIVGVGLIGYTVWKEANISDSGLLIFLTGLQVGLFGLLADVSARVRSAN